MKVPVHSVRAFALISILAASTPIFGGAPKGLGHAQVHAGAGTLGGRRGLAPSQRGTTEPDGSYVLEIPYSDDRELLGDLLRFGADVEVLAPPDLRSRIKRALHEAVGRYV